MPDHPSSSDVQIAKEARILAAIAEQIGVELRQRVKLEFDGAAMEVDGVAADESVLVEVFAHVGKLRGGQRHKISTDALKLIALSESRPQARLILAFADHAARDSVAGWKAAVLKHRGIELLLAGLSEADRAELVAAQAKQMMVNAPAEELAGAGD